MDPKIENIKIEPITFDFNFAPFNKPEIQNKIRSLLPKITQEEISFYLNDASCALANGLRRIICGELKIKIMTCKIEEIRTDEDFIIKDELIGRLNFIPIDQDLPLDTEFSLNIINSDAKKEFMIVHTADLQKLRGAEYVEKRPVFAETFRLAELSPGKHLVIPKIYLKEGYGYDYAGHCLTTQIKYYITDFIPISFLNERANIVSKRVKVTELIALFKKYKIKTDVNPDDLFRKTILIIPNKSYQHQITALQKEIIKKYEIVVENPESWVVDETNFDDKFLKGYQSTEIRATRFFLSFRTCGNIEPKTMMIRACDTITERLENLRNSVLEITENSEKSPEKNEKTEGAVSIIPDNIKALVIIRNEDYTIANLLKTAIFELDSSIKLINNPIEHPLNRTTMLNISHTQPIKILVDAIELCISHFQKIKKYFM